MSWKKQCFRKRIVHPFCVGIIVSVLVFFVGFFVMFIMYNYWQKTSRALYPDLKGLFDYKAALFGDSICLPVIIGAGTAYILIYYDLVLDRSRRLKPWIFATIAGVVGLLTQASWLLKDDTIPNWSIPEVHHFNYAGWYHAIYFVAISFAIAYIATCIIQIDFEIAKKGVPEWKDNPERYIAYYICQTLIWMMGILFLHFHYLDDYAEKSSPVFLIIVVSLLAFLVLFIEKLMTYKKKVWGKPLVPVVYAIIISTLVSGICICQKPGCDMALLVSGVLCSALYVYNSENKLRMLGNFVVFALLDCFMQINISVSIMERKGILAVILLVLCLAIPFLLSNMGYCQYKSKIICEGASHIRALVNVSIIKIGLIVLSEIDYVSALLFVNQEPERYQGFRELVDLIIANHYTLGASLITVYIFAYIKNTFPIIQTMEYNVGSKYTSKQLETAKISQYVTYFFAYFAALILLWKMLDFQKGESIGKESIVTVLFSLLVFILMASIIFYIQNTKIRLVLFVISDIILIAVMLWNLAMQEGVCMIEYNINLLWRDYFFIIYMSCSLTAFSAWNIISNTSLIRQRKVDLEVIITAFAFGIVGGTNYFIAACLLFASSTLYNALFLFATTMTMFCLLPFLHAWKINPGGNIGLLDNYARSGVAQDGFLYGIVTTANTLITLKCSRAITKGEVVIGIFVGLMFAGGLYGLWNYCMQNNREHLKKKKELFETLKGICSSDKEKGLLETQFDYLSLHLKVQNILAILITLPYSIIYYLQILRTGDEKTFLA